MGATTRTISPASGLRAASPCHQAWWTCSCRISAASLSAVNRYFIWALETRSGRQTAHTWCSGVLSPAGAKEAEGLTGSRALHPGTTAATWPPPAGCRHSS